MTNYLIIDFLNLLKRAQSVTQGDAYDRAGLAVMITLKSISFAFKKFNADHVVIALEGRSWRKDTYKQYKANRAVLLSDRSASDIDDDKIFFEIANDLVEFIKNYSNCTILQHSRCEADDFIARWTQNFPNDNHTIVSSDSDFVQLLSNNIQIYNGVDKKLLRIDGIFDEKMQPWKNKKGQTLETIDPEYALFEKCIRGDSGDNVPSAYPGVRSKGSSKKIGILDAFSDRNNQGFTWVNFFNQKWTDIDGVDHKVEDDYKRNELLIDLRKQPDEIKNILDITINDMLQKRKDNKQIGIHFLKFCGKHSLVEISKKPDEILKFLNKGYEHAESIQTNN